MTKSSLLLRIYALLLCVVFGGIVVTAPLTVGFGTLFPDWALLIKAWKEVLMGAAFILAVVLVTKRGMWRQLMNDWAIRLIAAFGALHILLLLWHWQGAKAAAAGLLIDLRYLLFFVLVYVLVKLAPWYRLRLLIVGAFGAMVVVIFGFLQLFLPRDILSHIGYGPDTIAPYLTVDRNPNYVRINSTLRGPNPLGAYTGMVLVMMLAICGPQIHRFKNWKRIIGFGAVMLFTLATLWVSYSRSALGGTVVALAIIVIVLWWRQIIQHKVWLVAGIVIVICGALIVGSQSSFVDNVIRHNNPGTGAKVTSDAAHLSSLEKGSERLVRQPLGAGVGSTGSASILSDDTNIIENQYLFVAHESGWLGLGIYIAIICLVVWRAWRDRRDWLALGVFASGIGLLLIGLLLPVFADDTVSIVWWGLAGIMYAGVVTPRRALPSAHDLEMNSKSSLHPLKRARSTRVAEPATIKE